ncbi:MAG TPA: hypothetical protein VFD06_11620, partial [Candidatus Polarisedimenticolia bacterium]|nr:hypothetical protein [Candidatus Polarisedimenticolia bacterium]
IAVLLNDGGGLPLTAGIADFALRPGASPGALAITWRTVAERDVEGFRLVEVGRLGTPAAETLVDCAECASGLGSSYRLLLARPAQGRTFYLDVLHSDGTSERFGPAIKTAPGRDAVGQGKARRVKSRPGQSDPAPSGP